MNGFKLMANSYRKAGEEQKAKLYDFIGSCTDDDLYSMFDSTAFNEIAKCYLRKAVKELVNEGEIEEDQAIAVRNRFSLLFDEMRAKEVCEK